MDVDTASLLLVRFIWDVTAKAAAEKCVSEICNAPTLCFKRKYVLVCISANLLKIFASKETKNLILTKVWIFFEWQRQLGILELQFLGY